MRRSNGSEAARKDDRKEGSSGETAWEKHSAINFITGRKRSRPELVNFLLKPVARLTPALKFREDPSMKLQPPSNDISGRPVQNHSKHFVATALQIMRDMQAIMGSTSTCDFKEFHDIEWWTIYNEQKSVAHATEVTQNAMQFKLDQRCFCGPGQETVRYRSCPHKPNGA